MENNQEIKVDDVDFIKSLQALLGSYQQGADNLNEKDIIDFIEKEKISVESLNDERCEEGWTIIHYAIYRGQVKLLNYLLRKNGIDFLVKTKEYNENTVLHILVESQHEDDKFKLILTKLQNYGHFTMLANMPNKLNYVPLQLCSKYSRFKELAMLEVVDINIFINNHHLLEYVFRKEESENIDIDFIYSLLERKRNLEEYFINIDIEKKCLILNFITQKGNLIILEKLLKIENCDFFLTQNIHESPFFVAIINSEYNLLELLLTKEEMFFDVDQKEWLSPDKKKILLEKCLDLSNLDLAKLLIYHGARTDNIDHNELKQFAKNIDDFFIALDKFNYDILNEFVSIIDLNIKNHFAKTAVALVEDKLQVCKYQVSTKQFDQCCELYAFLIKKGAKKGRFFTDPLCLESDIRLKIEAKMQDYYNSYNVSMIDPRLFMLEAKSRRYEKDFSGDGRDKENSDLLRSLYQYLLYKKENIDHIEPILDVIAYTSNPCTIYYDFYSKNLNNLKLGNTTEGTKGAADFIDGNIYVGADETFEDIAGTLIHEFTHIVCSILWNNDCKPYTVSDIQAKKDFSAITQHLQNNQEKLDKIIKSVFKNYGANEHEAELIVRIPHMIAKYGKVIALEKLDEQAPTLLKYYEEKFLPKCHSYIKEKQADFKYQQLITYLDNVILNQSDDIENLKYLELKGKIFSDMEEYLKAIEMYKKAQSLALKLGFYKSYLKLETLIHDLNSQIKKIDPTIAEALDSSDEKIRLYAQYQLALITDNLQGSIDNLNKLIQTETDQIEKIRLIVFCSFIYGRQNNFSKALELLLLSPEIGILYFRDNFYYGNNLIWLNEIELFKELFAKMLLYPIDIDNVISKLIEIESLYIPEASIIDKAELIIMRAELLAKNNQDYIQATYLLLNIARLDCEEYLKQRAKNLSIIYTNKAFNVQDEPTVKPKNNEVSQNRFSFYYHKNDDFLESIKLYNKNNVIIKQFY